MHLVVWALLCVATAVLLRRRPVVAAGLVITLWAAVPGIASGAVTGVATGGLASHPATFLILACFMVRLVVAGRALADAIGQRIYVYTLLLAVVVAAGLTTRLAKTGGLVLVVDQLIAPVLLFAIVHSALMAAPSERSALRNWFLTIAALESGLAITQRLTGHVLFYGSYYQQQRWFDPVGWTRWMGTIDHPLGLSFLICLAVPFIADLRRAGVQVALIVLMVAAVIITQSRTGLFVVGFEIVYVVLAARVSEMTKVVLGALTAVGLAAVASTGLLSDVENRLVNDSGSAAARSDAFEFFVRHLGDFLVVGGGSGSSYDVARAAGLITSLESAIYIYAVDFGLFFALIYFATQLGLVIRAIGGTGGRGTVLAGVAAVVVPQTYSSLGADTSAAALLWVVLAMCAAAAPLRPISESVPGPWSARPDLSTAVGAESDAMAPHLGNR